MSNVYKDIKEKIGTMIIIIWPVAIFGVLASIRTMKEDFMSTVYAYDQIPTFEVTEGEMGYVVAAMLMACQLVFSYMYLADTTKEWCRGVAVTCAIFDILTDTWFKMGGELNWALLPWALSLSIVVFTVISELVFTVFVGFIAQTTGDFLKAIYTVINSIVDAILWAFRVRPKNSGDDNPTMRRP